MEIITGKYKGKLIETLSRNCYRPTTSRIRKSIFDILGNLEASKVLDLFAGSGILGFEAASRGACEVTFIENNFQLLKLLRLNSAKFDQTDIIVKRSDVFSFLPKAGNFDLVFADPPYGKVDLKKLIDLCRRHIRKNGKFLLESSIRDKLPPDFSREKVYGDTRITFWESIE
ncbi:MAG: RsmD family RNA methyltransferase [Candidatus Marinimicrobia bacterium]|nr:RsmD family RNA methyltransferase [Candidatus Neomarinimicrobiota bacterium]